jgi:hypothetical protein
MHRQISVDGLSLEELYDVEPIERTVDAPVVEQDSVFVSCLYCKRQVRQLVVRIGRLVARLM